MTDFASPNPAEEPAHKEEQQSSASDFPRARWNHPGAELDQFFQVFVPKQYEEGFCWRCKAIGQGEETRVTAFDDQPRDVQELIARNAEVLLELFEDTAPRDLDIMRESGKILLSHTGSTISSDDKVDGDVPSLREAMSRRHHEKWLEQFNADIASGKRQDPDHRGAKPFDELPEIEQLIMKVQTLANWRVLGSLSDSEYKIIRDLAVQRSEIS